MRAPERMAMLGFVADEARAHERERDAVADNLRREVNSLGAVCGGAQFAAEPQAFRLELAQLAMDPVAFVFWHGSDGVYRRTPSCVPNVTGK